MKHQTSRSNSKLAGITLTLSLATILALSLAIANGQETKGGSSVSSTAFSQSNTKGSGGFSSFRQSIQSVRQRQQQLPAAVQQVSELRRTSSSSVVQAQPIVQTSVSRLVEESSSSQTQQTSDSEPTVYGSVDGVSGVDFPGYTSIPNTKFSCEGVPFNPGMYADESTGCQVYHLCYDGRRESFLCGIGTVFNQAIMGCDFWYSVECSRSSQYYGLNSEYGKASAEFASVQQPLQQAKISSGSFSEQRETSTVQVAPPPPVVSSSSFRQQSSVVSSRPVQVPVQNSFSRVESSSFSSGGKSSPPKSSFASSRSFEHKSARSSDFVSPVRQLQLLSNFASERRTGGAQQLAAASSDSRPSKVSLPAASGPLTVSGAESAQSSAASESVQVRMDSREELEEAKKEKLVGEQARQAPAESSLTFGGQSGAIKGANEVQTAGDSGVWKPYSRRSKAPASPSAHARLGADGFSGGASTGTPTSTTEAPSSPPASADQEPAFAGSSGPAEERPAPSSEAPASAEATTAASSSPGPDETTTVTGSPRTTSGDKEDTGGGAEGSQSASSTPNSSVEYARELETSSQPPTTTTTAPPPTTTTTTGASATTSTAGKPTAEEEEEAEEREKEKEKEKRRKKRRNSARSARKSNNLAGAH